MVKPCGSMWGIMVPRKYPHQQKYPWIKDNSKPPCSPRSAIHLPSYLGKTRWREWVSFIGIFYQLLGQFDLKKTSCSGERAIPNSVLFPILFHYIMAYMHAKSQVFIWGGKRGRIFLFTHQPAPFIIQQKHCLKGIDKNKNLKVAKLIESTWDEHHVDLDTSRTQR